MCITEHFFSTRGAMTTTTANLLQKYVIMREVSIIGIPLSQWSDFTFTWMNITFWAHYGLKHSLYSNMYVPSDSVDMKHPSFFFHFHCDLEAHFGQLSSLFDTAEPIWIPKHLLVLRHAKPLSHSIWISSKHLVHCMMFHFVFGHMCLGEESLSACSGSQELLNLASRTLWCTFWCNDWEKWPTCPEFWLLAIKML